MTALSNAVRIWKGINVSFGVTVPSPAGRHLCPLRHMNRDGNVRWARLEKGPGYDHLDDESLALMDRAQPLPPPEVTGEPIEIVAPIQFSLK